MSLTNFKKVFIHRMDLFVFMSLILILLGLGRWQWHRSFEKQVILNAFERTQKLDEQEWDKHRKPPHPFQKIEVHGNLLNQVIYLDNQFRHHQVGYDIYVPLEVAPKTLLLIHVTWLPIGQDRNHLPLWSFEPLTTWHGYAYYPLSSKVDLGHFLEQHDDLHYVVERMDTQKIAEILGQEVLPWVLKTSLSKEEIVRVSPQKHIAYAIQWWAMALVVFIILMWRLIKK